MNSTLPTECGACSAFVRNVATAAAILFPVLTGCGDDTDGTGGGGGGPSHEATRASVGSGSTQTSAVTSGTTSGGGHVCAPNAAESCYSGDLATMGVGSCVAGTRTCLADGSAYGPCNGEVVPVAEDCSTAADEDCDGTTPPCEWATVFGGVGYQAVLSAAARPQGGVIVTGTFQGHFDYGLGTADSKGNDDVFVAALDSDGDLDWVQTFGSEGYDKATVAVNAVGQVAVAGRFTGPMKIGPFLLSTIGEAAFVATFQADGTPVAAKGFSETLKSEAIGFDASGAIVAMFTQDGPADWGPSAVACDRGSCAVRATLNANLDTTSAIELGSDDTPEGSSSFALNGAVIIAGSFTETVDVGRGPVASMGAEDIFVQRFNANGAGEWGFTAGSAVTDEASAAVDDGNGGAIVGGHTYGTLDLGGNTSPLAGQYYLTHLDPRGHPTWATPLSSDFDPGFGRLASVSSAPSGHVYAVGYAAGMFSVGSTTLDLGSTLLGNGFLADLDAGGAPVGGRRLTSGPSGGAPLAVTVGASGEVYVVGYFSGNLDTPSGVVPSTGATDGFVYRIVP